MWSSVTPLDVCGWLWLAVMFYWIVAAQFALKVRWIEGFSRLQHTIPTTLALIMLFHRGAVVQLDWGVAFHSAAVEWGGVVLTAFAIVLGALARCEIGKYWSGTVTLKQDHQLVTSGLYRYVRHPIYTALILAALGTALAAARWEAFAAVVLLLAAYIVKLRREEKLLLQEFGRDYVGYMARTDALFPYIF